MMSSMTISPLTEPMVLGSPGTSPPRDSSLFKSPLTPGAHGGFQSRFAQRNHPHIGGGDPVHNSGVGFGSSASAISNTPPVVAGRPQTYAPAFLLGTASDSPFNTSLNAARATPPQNMRNQNTVAGRQVTWSPDLVQQIPHSPSTVNSPGGNSRQQRLAGGQNGVAEQNGMGMTHLRRQRQNFNAGPPLRSLTSEMSAVESPSLGLTAQRESLDYCSPSKRIMLGAQERSIRGADREEHSSLNYSTQDLISASKSTNLSMIQKMSPEQIDPFYTQGDDFNPENDLDPTWVTVFGFPPQATSFILQKFSEYGAVLHHVIPDKGNWIHIHYKSPIHARNALSKNGKIYNQTLQIGVTYCINKDVIQRFRNEDDRSRMGNDHNIIDSPNVNDSAIFASRNLNQGGRSLPPWQTSTPAVRNIRGGGIVGGGGDAGGNLPLGHSGAGSILNTAKTSMSTIGSTSMGPRPTADDSRADDSLLNRSGMRSLTAAYEAARSPYKVTGGLQTPTKAGDSLLSQALGYVFGNK